jgi:hypothetical protein
MALSILSCFPLWSHAQQSQPTGNQLFVLLNKPAASAPVQQFEAFYALEKKDNTTRWQPAKGIECQLKKEKVKKIVLHNAGDNWTAYAYDLPLGLQWNFTEKEVVQLFGPKENGLPYHYDTNLDIDPKYEGEGKQLSAVELKFTNYSETDSKEMDDDALLALFLSNPQKFKYLKQQNGQTTKAPGAFDKTLFKKELGGILQFFVDRKTSQLQGDYLSEQKSSLNNSTKFFASTQPISQVVNQYLQLKQLIGKLEYVIVLQEIPSPKAGSFPPEVLKAYDQWLGLLKEWLATPWTVEEAEVYEGILDKGVTFENKTGQFTKDGFTYNKFPLVDCYIVYKQEHYSLELNIYGAW